MNRTAYIYLILCLAGIVLPLAQLVPWIANHGIDLIQLMEEAASTRIGAFAWIDVIISAIVLIFFIQSESSRQKIKNIWLPIAGTCLIGVSCGLPLFLLMRERQKIGRG